jgi:DNA modification methylase
MEIIKRFEFDANKANVVWGNCLASLKRMDSESVGLMVTSPPYYNAREYSQWPTLKAYLDEMRVIIQECYRVLDNHRVIVWNVSDVVGNDMMEPVKCWGERKIPLAAYFITMFEECGFRYTDDIIWDKGEVQSSRNKNKPYPFFQYPINCYEHILVFHKHRLEKDIRYPCSSCGSLTVKSNSYTYKGLRSWECCNPDCNRSESDRGKRFSLKTIITQDDAKRENSHVDNAIATQFRRDIVRLPPVIKINSKKQNKLGHTAPFPIIIPEMAINFFSYKGDVVLDMFGGSMTTAIAAKKLGRVGVGMELRKDLFEDCIRTNIQSHGLEICELAA